MRENAQGKARRYVAEGRITVKGVTYRTWGIGATATRARLNLLHQQGRRRHPVD